MYKDRPRRSGLGSGQFRPDSALQHSANSRSIAEFDNRQITYNRRELTAK